MSHSDRMLKQDQATMTENVGSSRGSFCNMNLRDILSLISSLFLPMMLGIFTVVITLHQQTVVTEQRLEDRQLAREQREQDLNMSREQRQQDLLMFALQREQLSNLSREQRDHDFAIAEAKRTQDSDIAERQRNMSQVQRDYELNTTQEQFRDTLLVSYINDMALLLMANHGTLTADPIVATIARAKTLAAIRQLDTSRKRRLIEFLYEAKQLHSSGQPLDLSDAELNGLNFSGGIKIHRSLRYLSLAGALLINSSFSGRDLIYANFTRAELTGAQFVDSQLGYADLSHTIIVRANFHSAQLSSSRFDYAHSRRAMFSKTNASNATFIHASLASSDFSTCDCRGIDFFDAKLTDADFSRAKLQYSRFKAADLSGAIFNRTDFSQTIFIHAKLSAASFVGSDLRRVELTRGNLREVYFKDVDLSDASLAETNLDLATFNRVATIMTNFSFASMKNASISNEQFINASSVRGAILPNGTVIREDPNMLPQGQALCHESLINNSWLISPANAVVISPESAIRKGACLTMSSIFPRGCLNASMRADTIVLSLRIVRSMWSNCEGHRMKGSPVFVSKIISIELLPRSIRREVRLERISAPYVIPCFSRIAPNDSQSTNDFVPAEGDHRIQWLWLIQLCSPDRSCSAIESVTGANTVLYFQMTWYK